MAITRKYTPDATADSPNNGNGNANGVGSKPAQAVGVRYGAMNWIGEFRLPARTAIRPGEKVVVQSDRGIELGESAALTCPGCCHLVDRGQIKCYIDNSGPEFYRLRTGKVLRGASAQDIDEHQRLNGHVQEDVNRCERLASELNLDVKIVTAEHLLGGERIVFYFRSEGRIDFRDLVRELASHYQTRIEMRQVGARDEARLVADYEVCGRECCCKGFLKKLRPITMRMAKLQKSTLDPSKVSGRCGRLRCCLRYEHEGYDALLRSLPRIGTQVQTEDGPATVVDRQILTQLVLVRGENDRTLAVPVDELRPPDESPPKQASHEEKESAESTPETADASAAEGRPRRRRRPRRRQKPPAAGGDRREAGGTGDAAASEQSPTDSRPDQLGDNPAGDSRKPDGERRSGRRRRRRRRPRRDQSDQPPGPDAS